MDGRPSGRERSRSPRPSHPRSCKRSRSSESSSYASDDSTSFCSSYSLIIPCDGPPKSEPADSAELERLRDELSNCVQENIRLQAKATSLKEELANEKANYTEMSQEFQKALDSERSRREEISQKFEKEIANEWPKKVSQLQENIESLDAELLGEKAIRQAAEKEKAAAEKELSNEREKSQNAVKMFASASETIAKMKKEVADEQQKRENAQKRLQEMETAQQLLESRLQEQKRISSLASHEGIWQFEESNGWHAVPLEGSAQMTQDYLIYLRAPTAKNRFAMVNSAGVARNIDFQLMQQKRTDTNKVRNIRFCPGVPAQWTTSPANLLLQSGHLPSYYVAVTDAQIQAKVLELLQTTGHALDINQPCSCMQKARVKSIHRIENRRLWQGYKLRRDALRKAHATYNFSVTPASLGSLDLDAFNASQGSSQVMTNHQDCFDCGEALALDVDEKILLHGTSYANANIIVLNGFDNRICCRGMYGEGVYFASAACKSHQYTCQTHKQGCLCKHERTLIIARVALGDAYHAKETRYNERRPPVKSNTFGVPYDSIVVNPGPIKGHHQTQQIHQEFVIFHTEQAYPCYVVQYEM